MSVKNHETPATAPAAASVLDSMRGRRAYSALVRLGLPILVGQLGMIVVGFADTKMVGLYSTEALASASFVNNLFNVAIFACIGFSYGLTPLIGALFSQSRYGEIGRLLRNGLWLNIWYALLITAVMTAIYLNLDSMGQPSELMPLIRPYFLIYMAGVVPIAAFNAFAQWSYAIGRTSLPMWIMLSANVVNIAGNWLLIYGHCGLPELGLLGAGISTLVARLLCVALIAVVFGVAPAYSAYRRGFAGGRLGRRRLLSLLRTSLPVSLQMSFESGSFTIAAVMSGWLGAVSLAAFQVVVIMGTLGFCVYYSVAAALSVLVSNAAGAGSREMMRHVAWSGYHVILLLALCASCIFIFAGPAVIGQFTDDERVLTAALSLIVPLVIYQFGDATQITFANALRGTAQVMPMIWIAFVCYVVIGIPATYMLGFTFGLGEYGIILSFSVSLLLAAALFTYFFLRATRPAAQ